MKIEWEPTAEEKEQIRRFLESDAGKNMLARAGQALLHRLDDKSPEDERRSKFGPRIDTGALAEMRKARRLRTMPYRRTKRDDANGT